SAYGGDEAASAYSRVASLAPPAARAESSAACAWSISFCGGPEHAAARINPPTMTRRRTRKVYQAMKTVAQHDRRREKLERAGPSVLGDNELLAVVLGHGGSATDALAL